MPTFDDIEKAYEAKYSHDQEMDFRAVMRRNKLLGLWAAEEMGIAGADADAYAREVIESDFEQAGHEDVVAKVLADMTGKGLDVSDHIIRRRMEELLETAREQIAAEAD